MEESINQSGQRLFLEFERFHKYMCRNAMSHRFSQNEMMIVSLLEEYEKRNADGPGIMPSDITRRVMISKPIVSRTLGILEEKGYLVRTMSKEDRRVIYIKLTEQGKKVLEEEKNHRNQMINRIVERMGEEKMNELSSLVNELVSFAIEEGDKEFNKMKHNKEE